jgi:hypothetical protein
MPLRDAKAKPAAALMGTFVAHSGGMAEKYRPLRFARRIGDAIQHRCLIRIRYDGETRLVAPYLYGRSVKGKMILSGFQIRNLTDPEVRPAWRTFDEQGITELEVLGESFRPRGDYNAHDRNFNLTVFSVPERRA